MSTSPTLNRLNSRIRDGLARLGIRRLTSIQEKAIPKILENKNVLVISPTGTGKTECALLPIFHKILEEYRKNKGIIAIYITPLRALNRDLLRRLEFWSNFLEIKIEVRHGDTPAHIRRKQAKLPPKILITTPETLQAILPGKLMRENLKGVRFVVVDEIHEFFEDKRGVQLAVALERLKEITNRKLQRIGLSATIGNVDEVAKFLAGGDDYPEIVEAEEERKINLRVEHPLANKKDMEKADLLFTDANVVARLRRIHELIRKHGKTLIFVNTRETAETLASRFKKLFDDVKLDVHHSSLSRDVRIATEEKFKSGKLSAIICTSSLELGIDIGDINLVIQYNSPRQVIKLLQRIGRARHWYREVASGVIIAGGFDDILESLAIAMLCKKFIEKPKMHRNALDVLANQIIGLAMDFGEISKESVFKVIKRAYPFNHLSYREFLDILEFLSSHRMIRLSGDKVLLTRKARDYYFENLSMIPDESQYSLVNIADNRKIGMLDESFVAKHVEPDKIIICKGQAWKILSIEENAVFAEPSEDVFGAIPSWEGDLLPVSYEVAKKVGELRRKVEESVRKGKLNEIKEIFLLYGDNSCFERVVEVIRDHVRKNLPVANDKRIVIESSSKYVVVHACFGNQVNEAFSRYLLGRILYELGESVFVNVDAYRIVFETSKHIDASDVKKLILDASNIEENIINSLKGSVLLNWKIMHVLRKFGVARKSVDYSKVRLKKIIELYTNTPIFKEAIRDLLTEKIDVKKFKEILERVKNGEIEVVAINTTELSPIAKQRLEYLYLHDIVQPKIPESVIMEIVKNRLLNSKARLLCMYCGEYETSITIKNLPDLPRCKKCGARLLAVVESDEMRRIIRKWIFRKKLSKKEQELLAKARRTADLVLSYGKKAVICLAGRGVGPQTAARILSRMHRDERDFYKDIIEAERQFIRTKKWWRR